MEKKIPQPLQKERREPNCSPLSFNTKIGGCVVLKLMWRIVYTLYSDILLCAWSVCLWVDWDQLLEVWAWNKQHVYFANLSLFMSISDLVWVSGTFFDLSIGSHIMFILLYRMRRDCGREYKRDRVWTNGVLILKKSMKTMRGTYTTRRHTLTYSVRVWYRRLLSPNVSYFGVPKCCCLCPELSVPST